MDCYVDLPEPDAKHDSRFYHTMYWSVFREPRASGRLEYLLVLKVPRIGQLYRPNEILVVRVTILDREIYGRHDRI